MAALGMKPPNPLPDWWKDSSTQLRHLTKRDATACTEAAAMRSEEELLMEVEEAGVHQDLPVVASGDHEANMSGERGGNAQDAAIILEAVEQVENNLTAGDHAVQPAMHVTGVGLRHKARICT